MSATSISSSKAKKIAGARPVLVAAIGVAAVLASIVFSLSFGSRPVSGNQIIEGVASWLRDETASDIGALAVQSRIPRTTLALLAGAALAVSCGLMQAITRNPIADPGILGINTGAALAVVVGIAFLGVSTAADYLGLALIGAFLSALFVYFVGSIGPGGATPIKLALAGVATTAALSSLVAAILLPRKAVMDEYRYWQVGDVSRANWETIGIMLPVLITAGIVALLCAPSLNTLALGDEVATGLGVKVGRIRLVAAIAGVVLCAAVTALAGPIGFVGLMIMHTIRLLVGSNQRWLLPLSAIGGAVLLTLADTIGRVVGSPGEVESGIITAFLGAPVLILIARRTRLRGI